MNNDKISICIPTYNGELYLKQCLESCLDQTYSNFEIIICDDGSTDKTPEIVNDFAEKNATIRVFINEKNLGLVANWNNCIKNSTGKWIKFVFQDDYISKDCLSEFVSSIKEDTKIIVSKRNFILDNNAGEKEKQHFANKHHALESALNGNFIDAKAVSKLAVRNICINFIAEPSLTLFKKDIVNDMGYFDDEFLQICDLEFFQRLGTNYGLTYLPVQNCFFRLHEHSATSGNLTEKGFILRYLEPLVLANKMAEEKEYQSFRNNLNVFEKLRLNLYINSRLLEAQHAAKQNSHNETIFLNYGKQHPWLLNPVKASWFYNLILNVVYTKRKIS
jgi:glycosyltransferase involved in cell wall biosynthesis